MKRLLVTGVPGWLTDAFLASAAAEPLADVREIRCMVQPGTRAVLPVAAAPEFTVVEAALEDEQAVRRAVSGCDAVLHAAGLLHVRRTSDWYRVNTSGTDTLLKAAKSCGVKRFVLISSNAAAGRSDSATKLMDEEQPARPLSHYGRSKLLAEKLTLGSGIEGVVLRPCMFYGPPVPIRHVEVYRRILEGKMPMVGTGDYARSVTYIDNLVQACRLALVSSNAPGQVYYIADGPVYSTRQVVEAMASALNCSARFIRLPAALAPLCYTADRCLAATGLYWQNLHLVGEADWHVGVSIQKARRELGYNPTIDLHTGMQRAIEWCRQQHLLDI